MLLSYVIASMLPFLLPTAFGKLSVLHTDLLAYVRQPITTYMRAGLLTILLLMLVNVGSAIE